MAKQIQRAAATKSADVAPVVTVRLFKREADSKRIMDALTGRLKKDDSNSLLEPHPIGAEMLATEIELSSMLRPNIDTYVTNIETQGHYFEPAIDLNEADADERVSDALYVTALLEAKDGNLDLETVKIPSDEEVQGKIISLRRTARLELARVRSFFSSCNPDGTFEDLRKLMRQDLETTGNAYWEMLRGQNNELRTFHHVPSVSMRISKAYDDVVTTVKRRITDLTWELIKVRRRFYRYAEVSKGTNEAKIWYKAFGDPRVISQTTGAVFRDLLALKSEEGVDAIEATEIYHFSLHSCVSQYGLPRWIGNLPNVLGSRELDETNYDYFISNAVPALALLVSGGRFGKGVEEKLTEFFEEEVRGQRATHKLIVLEAETQRRPAQGPTVNPRIEFVPLRNAQVQDALFQNYDQRNAQKVGTSFRLPVSFTTGKVTLADLRLAEDQVFHPEREWFDAQINKFILPDMGIRFWEFKSNALLTRDPEIIGKLALAYGKEGFLLPAEVRKIAERVFHINLPQIKAKWAAQPMPFTIAIFGMKAGPAEAVREQGRQAGDPAPVDEIQSELGLDPEEAAVTPIRDNPDTDADSDTEANRGSLDPLESLTALGVQLNARDE